VLWRSWHLRTDTIHEKGECTSLESISSLQNYEDTLNLSTDMIFNAKGKKPIFTAGTARKNAFECPHFLTKANLRKGKKKDKYFFCS
jgi:hypothetical protein